MMWWLGGVMCKVAGSPLQMAENHLSLPTRVKFFTLTPFSSSYSFSSTSSTSYFGRYEPPPFPLHADRTRCYIS